MLLKSILAGAGIAAAVILAPTVDAQPAFCDNHGSGNGKIYIHACAGGDGGGSALWVPVRDENGAIVKRVAKDGELKPVLRCTARCGGRWGVKTTEPY
jgi:hypothetical protein